MKIFNFRINHFPGQFDLVRVHKTYSVYLKST